jgi:hypothetical protein
MKGIMTTFNDDGFELSGAIKFGMVKCVIGIKNNFKITAVRNVTPSVLEDRW